MDIHFLPISAMEIAEKYYFSYLAKNCEITETPLYKYERGNKDVIKGEPEDTILMAIDFVKPTQTLNMEYA